MSLQQKAEQIRGDKHEKYDWWIRRSDVLEAIKKLKEKVVAKYKLTKSHLPICKGDCCKDYEEINKLIERVFGK